VSAALWVLLVGGVGMLAWAFVPVRHPPVLPTLTDEEVVALMRALGNDALADEYERGWRRRRGEIE
jgi:hypothetical protein